MLRWMKSAVVYQVRPERVGKIIFVCQKSRTQIVAYCACVKSSFFVFFFLRRKSDTVKNI